MAPGWTTALFHPDWDLIHAEMQAGRQLEKGKGCRTSTEIMFKPQTELNLYDLLHAAAARGRKPRGQQSFGATNTVFLLDFGAAL